MSRTSSTDEQCGVLNALSSPRYPHVVEYLEALPKGAASYPQCLDKGSGTQRLLKIRNPRPTPGSLPDEIARFIATAPVASAWIPTVVAESITLAIRDEFFSSDDDFWYWLKTTVRSLFRSPIYRVMLALASPGRLLASIQNRWEQFHRGSTLQIVDRPTPKSVVMRMRFPPRLYLALTLRNYAVSFAAAAEVARGRNVKVELGDFDETSALFAGSWE